MKKKWCAEWWDDVRTGRESCNRLVFCDTVAFSSTANEGDLSELELRNVEHQSFLKMLQQTILLPNLKTMKEKHWEIWSRRGTNLPTRSISVVYVVGFNSTWVNTLFLVLNSFNIFSSHLSWVLAPVSLPESIYCLVFVFFLPPSVPDLFPSTPTP